MYIAIYHIIYYTILLSRHIFRLEFVPHCKLAQYHPTSDSIPHDHSQQWLYDTAAKLLADTLMPFITHDPIFGFHHTFLRIGYLYVDLTNVIRHENGPHIVAHWKLWLPRFIATGCKNYATECVHLLTHLCADLSHT